MSGQPMTTVGEYIPIWWDGTPDFELVRGHLDPAAAKEELRRYTGYDPADYEEPVHRHARWVLPTDLSGCDRSIRLCDPGRGAFSVTAFYPRSR